MPKLNMETLLPFIEEAFNRDLDFQIPITGTSMNPLLYQNRDFVKIVKPSFPLNLGDIPLYRRKDGAFVLHRVVGVKENGEYIMCGDNQFVLEYGITDADIIGIAKTLVVDGKEIDVDTDEDYLKHKKKYLKNIKSRYPVRQLRYKLHFVKEKIHKSGMRSAECGSEGPRHDSDAGNGLDHTAESENVTQKILEAGSVLIGAIKAQITETDFKFPDNTDFKALYKLAQNHRVTAMVAPLVMKSGDVDSQIKGAFSRELFKTSARYTAQERERQELSAELSEKSIRHCFLKGSKVGAYYNNPDCRFMLDMDLYVEPQKFSEAENILVSRGYEISTNADDKDTGYIKKPFLIVELHKELKYDYDKGYEYYKAAFERMSCNDGCAMSMTDEDFYVYILSHTAHHFETAGTGIKSIVDHYFLRENLKPKCNSEILDSALEKIGLKAFNEKIDKLCDFWFKDGECDSLTEEISEYILLSGVFGNETNNYLNGVVRGEYSSGAESYFIKRLFPPLKAMKNRYTVLNKLPFLLPVFWGVRIVSSLVAPGRLMNETKVVVNTDSTQKDKQKRFFDDVGL